MGCKVDTVLNTLLCAADLIETYWDVKKNELKNRVRFSTDLIETYWDVKISTNAPPNSIGVDLIETYWDVKSIRKNGGYIAGQGFNRNILGCKDT